MHRTLVRKPDKKRLLQRHSYMWEDSIRMDFKGGIYSKYLIHDKNKCRAFVRTLMKLRVTRNKDN